MKNLEKILQRICPHEMRPGIYGQQCIRCRMVKLTNGYMDYVRYSIRRGMLPFCPICGEIMAEKSCFIFRCGRCKVETEYRPARVTPRMINLHSGLRMLRLEFYRVVDGHEKVECFCCNKGKLVRIGELRARCSFCHVTISRDTAGEFQITNE